ARIADALVRTAWAGDEEQSSSGDHQRQERTADTNCEVDQLVARHRARTVLARPQQRQAKGATRSRGSSEREGASPSERPWARGGILQEEEGGRAATAVSPMDLRMCSRPERGGRAARGPLRLECVTRRERSRARAAWARVG